MKDGVNITVARSCTQFKKANVSYKKTKFEGRGKGVCWCFERAKGFFYKSFARVGLLGFVPLI